MEGLGDVDGPLCLLIQHGSFDFHRADLRFGGTADPFARQVEGGFFFELMFGAVAEPDAGGGVEGEAFGQGDDGVLQVRGRKGVGVSPGLRDEQRGVEAGGGIRRFGRRLEFERRIEGIAFAANHRRDFGHFLGEVFGFLPR